MRIIIPNIPELRGLIETLCSTVDAETEIIAYGQATMICKRENPGEPGGTVLSFERSSGHGQLAWPGAICQVANQFELAVSDQGT